MGAAASARASEKRFSDARAPLAAADRLALPAASGSELGGALPRFGAFGTRASPLVRPRPIPAAASVHDGRSPPPAATTRRVAGRRRERCDCSTAGPRLWKDEPRGSRRVEDACAGEQRARGLRSHRSDQEPSAVMMNPIAATRRVSWFEAEGVFETRFSAAEGLRKRTRARFVYYRSW